MHFASTSDGGGIIIPAITKHVIGGDNYESEFTVLGELPGQFQEKYPDSIWAQKTIAWMH